MKNSRLFIRVSEAEREQLERLTESFGFSDLSTTVRFVVREECIRRGLSVVAKPPPRKKAGK